MGPPFTLPPFQTPTLLTQALTHRSYTNEAVGSLDNERLEFLGDAILTFLSGEYLYQRFAHHPEGQLTTLRSSLVDERQLAQFARWLNLGPRLRLSRGTEQQGGRQNDNLLSSAFEAIVGAYFLDQASQIDRVRPWVWSLFAAAMDPPAIPGPSHPFSPSAFVPPGANRPLQNPKGQLQELLLAQGKPLPRYRILQSFGPDHQKQFVAEVFIPPSASSQALSPESSLQDIICSSLQSNPEIRLAQGSGSSKQEAEKNAALKALDLYRSEST